MTITYRPCIPDDIDAVLALWVEGGQKESTDNAGAIARRLKRDPQLIILAWNGATWDGWRANMYRLVVSAEYRRQGIASQLVQMVQMVEEELRKLGVTRVYALALINSTQAGLFWHRHGYRPNSRIEPLAKTLYKIINAPSH